MENLKQVLIGVLIVCFFLAIGCSKKKSEGNNDKLESQIVMAMGKENISKIDTSISNIESLEEFSEGFAAVSFYTKGRAQSYIGEKYGFFNDKFEVVIQPLYDKVRKFKEGFAAVEIKYKWGYINKKGKGVIGLQYDDARDFGEGLAAVQTKERWGFIDQNGKMVIEPRFDDAGYFSNGLAPVMMGSSWGYIDKAGKYLIEPRFSSADEFRDGIALVGNSVLIDTSGNHFFKSDFGSVRHFSEGLAAVTKMNGDCTFIDKSGEVVIKSIPRKLEISDPNDFYNGYAIVSVTIWSGPSSFNLGKTFIDRSGKILTGDTLYENIKPFSDGMARVSVDFNRWGCIDQTGKLVIPMEFDEISQFSNGKAIAEMGSRKGFIDKTGKWVE